MAKADTTALKARTPSTSSRRAKTINSARAAQLLGLQGVKPRKLAQTLSEIPVTEPERIEAVILAVQPELLQKALRSVGELHLQAVMDIRERLAVTQRRNRSFIMGGFDSSFGHHTRPSPM